MPPESETVWNLSLQDIERDTGRVLDYEMCRVSNLGSTKTSFGTSHVLYSKLRPYLNKVVVPNRNGVGTSELIPMRPDPSLLDREFLAFYLRSRSFLDFASANTRGANLPRIAMRELWRHEIAFPCLAEQRRIVAAIDVLLQRANEISSLRMQSLREAGALEGSVFADFLLEYLGDASACSSPLSEVLLRAQYGSSSKANTKGQGVPMLRMGNIQEGHLDVSDLKHIELPAKELAKYRLNEGDILFNRTNSLELVGKAAMFTGLEGDWVFASYLVRLEVDRDTVIPEYLTAVINSRIGREFVYRTARRAIGMVNINAKQIQQMELPLPPLEDQQYLVERMREAKRASEEIRQDLDLKPIEALPAAILDKAFAGEL